MIWELQVFCQGRVPVRLPIRMHEKYALAARVGLMRGAPFRKSQVSVSAEGCAEVQLCPPLHCHVHSQRTAALFQAVAHACGCS